jgi:aminoglycoside phosphotransferase (APT) family kinase protein
VAGVRREIATLPLLAPVLGIRVPFPAYVGGGTDEYPWPFFGWRHLPGDELVVAALDDEARRRVALDLARFLRRLHTPEVARAARGDRLPVDPSGRTDMQRRVVKAYEYAGEAERRRLWHLPRPLRVALARAERIPPLRAPTSIVHGDLHFRHMLVDRGRLCGVIDWANVCRADPSADLQVVWAAVPPPARDEFLRAYGSVTEEQLLRARVLATSLYAALAVYAHDTGAHQLLQEATKSLSWIAAD